MPTVHGVPVSPFVRKVRVALHEKGIDYELNPVAPAPPANATPEFRRMSPLGKVPAYEDGDFAISDSSVIIAYLERTSGAPALYPSDPQAMARALWLEEFADSRLAEGVGPIFFERRIARAFFQREPNQDAIDAALQERVPEAFGYLEGQIAGDHLAGGAFSVADIAVGSMLRTFLLSGESVDAGRWPALAGYTEKVMARPSFAAAAQMEDGMLAG